MDIIPEDLKCLNCEKRMVLDFCFYCERSFKCSRCRRKCFVLAPQNLACSFCGLLDEAIKDLTRRSFEKICPECHGQMPLDYCEVCNNGLYCKSCNRPYIGWTQQASPCIYCGFEEDFRERLQRIDPNRICTSCYSPMASKYCAVCYKGIWCFVCGKVYTSDVNEEDRSFCSHCGAGEFPYF